MGCSADRDQHIHRPWVKEPGSVGMNALPHLEEYKPEVVKDESGQVIKD